MKTITLDNGKKVEISNESHQAFIDAVNPEFKAADWVKCIENYGPHLKVGDVIRIDSSDAYCGTSCMSVTDYVKSACYPFNRMLVHATLEEIESHLIEEAEKRGYKEGVIVNCLQFNNNECLDGERFVYFSNDVLEASSDAELTTTVIYKKGKWAEIINDTIKLEGCDLNVQMLNGGDVEINGNLVKFYNLKAIYKAAKTTR